MFYTYTQNNSGGTFDFDAKAGISHYVVVEASSPNEANILAESIGLYFDGANDCVCCGDRWYTIYDEENGTLEPEVYGKHVAIFDPSISWMGNKPEGYVHYLDGRIVPFKEISIPERV